MPSGSREIEQGRTLKAQLAAQPGVVGALMHLAQQLGLDTEIMPALGTGGVAVKAGRKVAQKLLDPVRAAADQRTASAIYQRVAKNPAAGWQPWEVQTMPARHAAYELVKDVPGEGIAPAYGALMEFFLKHKGGKEIPPNLHKFLQSLRKQLE